MGLLSLSQCEIQRAKAAVAVRLEWAHAQLVGQDESLMVMGFGLFGSREITMRRDLAEEAPGVRLVPAFLMDTGKIEGSPSAVACVLQAAG